MNPSIAVQDASKIYRSQDAVDSGLPLAGLLSRNLPEQPLQLKIAVDQVSFRIGVGERVGIVGRNGAGKSTLLSMIAGIIEPSSGTVIIHGQVTSVLTLGVGLREDLSGRENIYLDGEVRGRSRSDIDHVIDEVIAFADIGEWIDFPVRTYSTGMKARLAFATTFHIEPEILLIDEALAVGDAGFSAKATRKIRELCGKGKIVVIVSHSMESIVEICNRCLWMEDGRIVMDGPPAYVTKAYVESIRKHDQVEMLGRFRSLIGAQSFRQGCEIESIQVNQDGNSEPKSIVMSGVETELIIVLHGFDPMEDPDVRFVITRLDGLIVTENYLRQDSEEKLHIGEATTCLIRMQPLVLAPGVYRIQAELIEGSVVLAERSIIIEVIAEKLPVGGRTALLYPCSVHAQAVAR